MVNNNNNTRFLQYLISYSKTFSYIEDIIGTEALEEMLANDTLISFLAGENLFPENMLWSIAEELITANAFFEQEENECLDEFDEYDDTDRYTLHDRKNKARQHRKALKNEKRGAYRSVPYTRNGCGLVNKLEKLSRMAHVMAQDVKNQEKELFASSTDADTSDPSITLESNITTETSASTDPSFAKTPEELIGEAFKNGYHAGYSAGFGAGYEAAIKKIKEELSAFFNNL